MFEIYTFKLPDTTKNESRLALQMLVMCSSIKSSISTANIDLVEKIGFDDDSLSDWRLFATSLNFLMNSVPDQTDNPSKYYKRLDASHPSIQRVIQIFHKYFFCLTPFNFDDVCSSTFSYIYKMCKTPNVASQQLIQELYERLAILSQSLCTKEVIIDDPEVLSQDPVIASQRARSNVVVHPLLNLPLPYVTRFVFIIGYAAMRELIYLDIDVYSNLKYRQELKDTLKTKHKNQVAAAHRRTMNESASFAMSQRLSSSHAETEPEDDVVGASTEDNVAEQITFVLEQEVKINSLIIYL